MANDHDEVSNWQNVGGLASGGLKCVTTHSKVLDFSPSDSNS
jgi:hypothetical protein